MEHQEYKELLAIAAVDALDGDDAQRFEAHLSECSDCRGELAELRDAGGLLAHGCSPATPSEEVRARIISAVRAESRSQKPVEPSSNVRPFQPRKRRFSIQLLKIAAVLALVAVMFVLISMFLVAQHDIGRLTADVEAQKVELNREREARMRNEEALTLLTSRDAQTIYLTSTQTAQNARAMFVFDQKSGRAVLMTDGLPMTSAEKAYEVWFIPKGKAPMPGKVFSVNERGHAMVMEQMPPEALRGAVIAISVEPKTGSSAPTGAIYLSSPAS